MTPLRQAEPAAMSRLIVKAPKCVTRTEPGEAFDHGKRERGHSADPVVERTNKGPVDSVVGGLARLDARCFRLHDLPVDHGADLAGVRCSADGCGRGLHRYAVAAPGRRNGVRLAGGSSRAEDTSDDLHPVVLDLQLHCWLLPKLCLPVLL